MNIAVVDDERIYRNKINEILKKEFPSYQIDLFSDTSSLLESKTKYKLLLMDLELQGENGFSFIETHYATFQYVIFVSSHKECALDLFGRNIMGFISKDSLEQELLLKVKNVINRMDNKVLHLKTKKGLYEVEEVSVQYFMMEYETIMVKMLEGNENLTISSLKKLEKQLDGDFFLINRSVIVNIHHIKHLFRNTHEIEITDGTVFKVSERRWTKLVHAYNKEVNVL